MMLGFLLARAGVDVVVLEKHADFLRDFRGDTVHPSTLNIMKELSFLDEFLKLPHQKVFQLQGWFGETRAIIADFSALPPPCNFIALMPQWDFLNFLAAKGAGFKTFRLLMRAQAQSLIEEDGRIVGVNAEGPDGPLAIRADLTIAADGRHSTLRAAAGLKSIDLGAPMDVLWFRAPRAEGDEEETSGRFDPGRIFIRLNRGDYWQCAYVIAKGSFDAVKARGFDAFKADSARLLGVPVERLNNLAGFDDVKLLSVAVDRLERWRRPGFLAIGDAAHAMSPMGGVGINLAVQDAVAAANILYAPLRDRTLTVDHLKALQTRREWPVKVTQKIQIAIQNNLIRRVLSGTERPKPPFAAKLLKWFPALQGVPARLIGIGVRPEHVQTPDAGGARPA
jgi:2-polyprenyl-6-methoxyphenol hydroxylase-like FAD-dependent oxidoreductase